MEQLIEKYCRDVWRSFKTFRPSGTVKQHSRQSFQEIAFGENRMLTITLYQDQRPRTLVHTDQWNIGFNNKRYLLYVEGREVYEIITLNHADLVLADPATNEKLFFARLPVWENFMTQGIISAL